MVALAIACGAVRQVAFADGIEVPIALQVQLLDRLLWYERTLQRDDQPRFAVLIVARPKHNESLRAASQLEAQLGRADQLGGRAFTQRRMLFESPSQLARVVDEQRAYLLYLAPGLEDVLPEIARALRGKRVLTVSTQGADVARGAVLGFELASSKPRIAVNLSRGRHQKMDFSAQLLRIARVIQ